MSKPKTHTFILSDESINAYGFRVLTNGIDLSAFEKNPVAFWNHRIDDRWKETTTMPIGKWSNLRKEGGKLLGDLEIDIEDPLGKELDRKIINGYVNACSINFDPIEISDSPEHLLVGQTRSTMTKSLLLECSPVGLPGNYGAVKLKQKEGGFISLNSTSTSTEIDTIIPRLQNTSIKYTNNMTTEQKQLLGLDANATDEQITTALNLLKAKAEKTVTTENPATTPTTALSNEDKTELDSLRKERITTLINGAVADKKISEAERETYTKLANVDFDSTKAAIEKMQPSVKITSLLNTAGGGAMGTATKVEDCEFMKLSKSNPSELARISREDEGRFNTMKEEYLQLMKTK